MRILYLHGYGVTTGGFKPTYLKSLGHDVLNPALPNEDFAESIRIAEEAFRSANPDVIVGSSRGGAVALAMDSGDCPLVLIAPAWKDFGAPARTKAATIILHSAKDDVILLRESRQLVANSGLAESRLRVVGLDHGMGDPEALDALQRAVLESVEL